MKNDFANAFLHKLIQEDEREQKEIKYYIILMKNVSLKEKKYILLLSSLNALKTIVFLTCIQWLWWYLIHFSALEMLWGLILRITTVTIILSFLQIKVLAPRPRHTCKLHQAKP